MSGFIFSTTGSGAASVYASDGTVAGTVNLDLGLVSQPTEFTVFGNRLYFIGILPLGTGPVEGSLEPVFGTDGTAAGTIALQDTSGVLFPANLGVVDGKLLASGSEFFVGNSIYASSDGINLNEISHTAATSPGGFVVSNGTGFFDAISSSDANLGLWRTDGTAAGTYSIDPAGVLLDPGGYTAVGGGNTIFVNEGSDGAGTLWVTNGTAAGTHRIVDAALGAEVVPGSAVTNGKAVFTAEDAAGRQSIWTTNGTSAGTTEILVLGPAGAPIRHSSAFTAFDGKVIYSTGYELAITDGSAAGTVILPTGIPDSFVTVGARIFVNSDGETGPVFSVSDGTVAGTSALNIPGLASINGPLTVVGNGVVFEGTDTSGRQALFRSDGTPAGSRELSLPAGVTVDATTVVAALPVSITPTQTLTGTLPHPLYTGTETITGTGGVTGLELERITQGTYNTPGSAGWVKASVQANGNWSAQLTFDKPGQLAHVYAENGGSTSVVDLVDGTPTTPVAPPPPSFTGTLPSPLHTGEETVTGTGGVVGLRLERITQGSYDTPGQTGWVTATVAADHSWSAQLIFTKPGMLAHVYAQNGGTGAVIDLVNGTPIAKAASAVSGSVVADMTAGAGVAASVHVAQLPARSISGGSLMAALDSTHIAALAVTGHSRIVPHIGQAWIHT